MKNLKLWIARDAGTCQGTFLYSKKPYWDEKVNLWIPVSESFSSSLIFDVDLKPGEIIEIEVGKVLRKGN